MARVLGNDPPERVLLEDVPAVGFGWSGIGHPGENEPFPACLRAVLRYAGESPACRHQQMADRAADGCDCSYRYTMATTGMAFFALWNAEEWDYASSSINVLAPAALAPCRRGLEAVALPYEIIGHEPLRGTVGVVGEAAALRFETYVGSDELRRRIVRSIALDGRPVIAFGVFGPLECCLVTGFDEGGDVLIGWSFFQTFPRFAADLQLEPTGQFRKRDWEEGTLGVIVVGDREGDVPVREASRDALRWAVELANRPTVHGRHAGLAAFQAYADTLRDDGRFPAAGPPVSEDCAFAIGDALQVHRRRHAADFVSQMAADEPDAADDLLAAAESYRAVADTMEQLWGVMGGEEQRLKLADPQVRGRMADLVLRARDHEAAAVALIEKALAVIDPAKHYVAAHEIRPELRNLLSFGTGAYPAPGLTPADEVVWAAACDLPPEEFAAEHAEPAGEYGCTQREEAGLPAWLDEGGVRVAMFSVCKDTDLDTIRRLYAALDETDCPLGWIFLRLTHWQEPVFDILSFSREHWMGHNNRVGKW